MELLLRLVLLLQGVLRQLLRQVLLGRFLLLLLLWQLQVRWVHLDGGAPLELRLHQLCMRLLLLRWPRLPLPGLQLQVRLRPRRLQLQYWLHVQL